MDNALLQALAGMFLPGQAGAAELEPTPNDRVGAGFADAMPRPESDMMPPGASPTVGQVPPGVPTPAPVPMPQPRPPMPPSGVPEGGPYNTGPGDQFKVAPPMWGPGAPNMMPPRSEAPDGGGIASALGLTPDRAAMLARALAGGFKSVKNSPFKGEVMAQGMGGALGGSNQYEDDQDKQKIQVLDRAIRMRGLDQNDAQHSDNLSLRREALDQGRFSLLPGEGVGPDGKPIPGAYKFNSKSGDSEFQPGTVLKPRYGGTGGNATALMKNAQWMVDNKIAPDLPTAAAMVRSGVNEGATWQRLVQAEKKVLLTTTAGARMKPDELEAAAQDNIVKRREKFSTQAPAGPAADPAARPFRPGADRPDLMTPGDGGKPLNLQVPPRPPHVPGGSSFSPSRNQWRGPDGTIYDADPGGDPA